ncbi:MAG: hypothetical protein SWX82_20520 [Cyanobacteriota bacterium]|nr:hypothetical protein [Cyanobacteriota bacterium]
MANARYPNRTRYFSAVRHPQIAFKNLDLELAAGKPVEIKNAQGIKDLWFAAGGFACVFQYQTFNPNKRWAVRCFLQSTSSVANHYGKVYRHLKNISCSSYFTKFLFQDKGIMVNGNFYPIVKMEWVEGKNLKDFIRDNKGNKSKLDALAKAWIKLSKDLVDAGIAHGDLQHGNILVDESNGINLKLIDYDSLYFKVDGNSINDEIKGLPGYQHPLRENLQKQCMEIDFFPQLVIYLSIVAIAEKPQLWKIYNIENTERLLFSLVDFQNPNKSKVFNDLSQLPSEISKLAKKLKQICNYTDFSKIPSLDTILTPPVQQWIPPVTSQQKTTQPPKPAASTATWNPVTSQQKTTQTPKPKPAASTTSWNPVTSQQKTTQTPKPKPAASTTSWNPVTSQSKTTQTPKPKPAASTTSWNPVTSQSKTTQTPKPKPAASTTSWNPVTSQSKTTQPPTSTQSPQQRVVWNPTPSPLTLSSKQQAVWNTGSSPLPLSQPKSLGTTNQTKLTNAQSSSGGNFVVKALAIISTIAAVALGGFCYYLYEEVREMKQNQKQLENQTRELKTEQNELQSRVNTIGNESNSKLPPGGQIIHSGYLSAKRENNLHIFWVNETGKFDFKLYDLDSDADFVLLNQQMEKVENSKRTSTGADQLNDFELRPGSYYVKVWLYDSQPTSYKLKISRH